MYECDFRHNDGHKLYRVKCADCGFETDMKKSDISKAKTCKHVARGGGYINYGTVWTNKRLKGIFSGMKARCYNEDNVNYGLYGAKGVKICDEWMRTPELFESWSLTNGYNDDLTIDRVNENGDYSPDNCRWATLGNNAKYKSTTSLIDVDGEIHTGRDWAKILGLSMNIINTYIRKCGLNNTVEFIRKRLKNPGLKPKRNQSYYDLYMN